MLHGGKIRVLSLCLLLAFVFTPALPPDAAARTAAETCPQFVQAVLERVHTNCAGVARNEACYAHNRVDALFWQPRTDLIFSAPADHVPLIDLRTIATTPLDIASALWGVAVLRLQADVPESLPGQVVTFVLMGDAVLENAVSPEQVAPPVRPVQTTTLLPANLRSLPTTTANILGSIPAGMNLALIGADETRGWYEAVVQTVGRAWVSGDLLARDPAGGMDGLPVTYGAAVAPRYGPMQAFYLRTGLATPICAEAPDALVVQNTSGLEVTLDVNGVRVSLGSTVILTTAAVSGPAASGSSTALVGVLIEGHVNAEAPAGRLALTLPGQAFAVTLNADGRVDAASQFIDLSAFSLQAQVRAAAVNACHNARQMNVLTRALTPAECAALANIPPTTSNPAPQVSSPAVSGTGPAASSVSGGDSQPAAPVAGGDPGQASSSDGGNGNNGNGNGGGNALGHTQDYGLGNNDRTFSNNGGGNGNGNRNNNGG